MGRGRGTELNSAQRFMTQERGLLQRCEDRHRKGYEKSRCWVSQKENNVR